MSLRTANHIILLKKEPRPSMRKYSLIFMWLIVATAQAEKETLYVRKVLWNTNHQKVETDARQNRPELKNNFLPRKALPIHRHAYVLRQETNIYFTQIIM